MALFPWILVLGTKLIQPGTTEALSQAETSTKQGSGAITARITIQGKPAAGLAIALRPSRYHIVDEAIANTETDESGLYRFTGLGASTYWLQILDPRYVRTDGVSSFDGTGRDVSVEDNESVVGADLELIPGGVVSGHVADREGKPASRRRGQADLG
jgi:hypothetical protein